jgi:branched-chain amino acid transport system ATP-binding protein
VREVTVSFGGIKALEDVSVDAADGEVVGVIGPIGAGKTTLFNVICGFVAPNSGTISWRDRSLNGLSPHRLSSMGISRTLQGVGLFSKLTVLENVMTGADRFRRARYGGALLGLWTSDRDERALRERARASLSTAPESKTAFLGRSRLRSRSAWRWPAPSPASPSCCSSTSPPAGWAPKRCPSLDS